MKTFLESVAKDIISKYGLDLSRIAVVFPNKRASLFLDTHLAAIAGQPIWSPSYVTISELFRSHSDLTVADPIKQVCDLHKTFLEVTGTEETLDHFYGWGQILLSDFDDLDKNMADARKVFANIADLHELDDVSYLTPEQVEVIRNFFSNFSADQNTELKRQFLALWSRFYDIYTAYNKRLADQGLAYEGALYRKVADDDAAEYTFDHYLFVGFNVLQKVEQKLFARLEKEGKASFYWDFDDYYVRPSAGRQNEAGHYVAQYLGQFPNALDNADGELYDNFRKPRNITFISSPTENAQARYATGWLREGNRIADGRQTAVVMCDETLLKSLVHNLPDEVTEANITTGYPLSQSPAGSFVEALIELQIAGYNPSTSRYRLRAVRDVLSHPYACYVTPAAGDTLNRLRLSPVYFLHRDDLAADEGMRLLFEDIDKRQAVNLAGRITGWIADVLRAVAKGHSTVTTADDGTVSAPAANKDPLFEEALFKTYTIVNRLDALIASGDLTIDAPTLQRLFTQLVKSTSIPFHGEPAVGLQIMGVLETRNIDFRHVLLLSCNDGNMPKGVNDTSFIPYSIRKAYGLTTIDNKVAIYAYYFYRLLQRATDITIMYNDTATTTSTGEMSRFMLQLMVESGFDIRREKVFFPLTSKLSAPQPLEKSAAVMNALRNRFDAARRKDMPDTHPLLTPSAVNRYLRCPLSFYYNYVAGLFQQDDPTDENMMSRLFGNIFHHAAETIYRQVMDADNRVEPEVLEGVLRGKVIIERAVDDAFSKELFNITDNNGRRPEYDGLQLINREVIITYLERLLQLDRRLAPFTICGLEAEVALPVEVDCGDGTTFTTRIGGRIDRLDIVDQGSRDEHIRVVDYKTGRKPGATLHDVDEVFAPENIEKHSDYFLQTFIYALLVRHSRVLNRPNLPVSPALLFIQNASADDYDPTLCLSGQPVTDIEHIADAVRTGLQDVVNEIFAPAVPFRPTDKVERCQNCPYFELCWKV